MTFIRASDGKSIAPLSSAVKEPTALLSKFIGSLFLNWSFVEEFSIVSAPTSITVFGVPSQVLETTVYVACLLVNPIMEYNLSCHSPSAV